jgi:hypothetical protein
MNSLRYRSVKKLIILTKNNLYHADASQEGLRCLLVGTKVISEQEFDAWHTKYHQAKSNITEIEKKKAGK